jgi:hypothetical protein
MSFKLTPRQEQAQAVLAGEATHQMLFGGGRSGKTFLNVRNIADTDPALVAQGPAGTSFLGQPANPTLYDTLGRTFRAGVRFKM